MKCPNCGADIIAGQKFCTECGYNLEEYFAKLSQTDQSSEPTTSPIQEAQPIQPEGAKKSDSAAEQNDIIEDLKKLFQNNVHYFVAVGILFVVLLFLSTGLAFITLIAGLGYAAYECFGKKNLESNIINEQIKRTLEDVKSKDKNLSASEAEQNKFLLIGSGAGLLNLITIIFLPLVTLSKYLGPLSSFLGRDGIGSLLSKYNNGDVSFSGLHNFIKEVKPLLALSNNADIIGVLNLISAIFYLVLISSFLTIVMLFIKKRANLIFIISGSVLVVVYGIVFYIVQQVISKITEATGGFISGPSTFSLLGFGFYVGLIAAIGILVIGIIGIRKTNEVTKPTESAESPVEG